MPGMVATAQRCCKEWQEKGRVTAYNCSKEYTFLVGSRPSAQASVAFPGLSGLAGLAGKFTACMHASDLAALPSYLQAAPPLSCQLMAEPCVRQVALKTILGFKDQDISAPMLARCSRLFRDWLNGLFSLGIALPGLSAP